MIFAQRYQGRIIVPRHLDQIFAVSAQIPCWQNPPLLVILQRIVILGGDQDKATLVTLENYPASVMCVESCEEFCRQLASQLATALQLPGVIATVKMGVNEWVPHCGEAAST